MSCPPANELWQRLADGASLPHLIGPQQQSRGSKSIFGKLWRQDIPLSSLLLSELLLAIAFTMLWVRIALGGAAIQCAIALGGFMGLAQNSGPTFCHGPAA